MRSGSRGHRHRSAVALSLTPGDHSLAWSFQPSVSVARGARRGRAASDQPAVHRVGHHTRRPQSERPGSPRTARRAVRPPSLPGSQHDRGIDDLHGRDRQRCPMRSPAARPAGDGIPLASSGRIVSAYPKKKASTIASTTDGRSCQPSAVAMTRPRTSPIAQPVRQWMVADRASRSIELFRGSSPDASEAVKSLGSNRAAKPLPAAPTYIPCRTHKPPTHHPAERSCAMRSNALIVGSLFITAALLVGCSSGRSIRSAPAPASAAPASAAPASGTRVGRRVAPAAGAAHRRGEAGRDDRDGPRRGLERDDRLHLHQGHEGQRQERLHRRLPRHVAGADRRRPGATPTGGDRRDRQARDDHPRTTARSR